MRRATALWLLTWALRSTAAAPTDTAACFELPIVILAPTDKPFPTKHCVKAPPPSDNCLKEHIDTDVEVIDHLSDPNTGRSQLNCVNDTPTSIYSSISHFRGQSSLGFAKHQYSVKLKDEAPLLGFPSEVSFVLNGPVIDGSLIRNHLAHWLYRATGRYSPRTRHMVMFVRDPATQELKYFGVYLALETIGYGPQRVGLAPLSNQCTPEQLNGGWAWQLNPLNYGVYSPNVVFDQYELMFGAGERPVLMYPSKKALTQSMRDYFVNTTTGPLPVFYRYLYDEAGAPEKLAQHIDLGAFVDYMLHSELSQNTDAYRRSTFFFKDRDEPINAGPVWDFNLAFGKGANQRDWLHKNHFLWKRLLTNYQFVALAIKRWRQLRDTVWKDDAIVAFIDSAVAPLERQFTGCREWHGEDIPCANVNLSGSFKSHVDRVKLAIQDRAKWMDENVVKFYGKIDKAVWAQATKGLPSYNCAADGEDSGCLDDPEPYVAAATIPPVRTPYNGAPCTAEPSEQPSIDSCWLSSGIGSYTFCSGGGYCPQGPGATCTCINGRSPPTCAVEKRDTTVLEMAQSLSDGSTHRWIDGAFVMLAVAAVVAVMATFRQRGYRATATRDERMPIAKASKQAVQVPQPQAQVYGTSD